MQDNLAYTVNTAIAPVTLPPATGGVGTIRYALTGTLPAGLMFDAAADARELTGTPTTAGGPTTLTYTATDMDTPPVVRTQTFTITVSTGLALPTQNNLAYTVGTAIDDRGPCRPPWAALAPSTTCPDRHAAGWTGLQRGHPRPVRHPDHGERSDDADLHGHRQRHHPHRGNPNV